MEYSQKYCAAQFLEPIADNTNFSSDEWPLHCTLAGVFRLEWNDERHQIFRALVSSFSKTTSRTTEYDYFGPDHDIHVIRVERTPEIMNMHTELVNFISSNNGQFKEPHYMNADFSPHVTIPKNLHVARNEVITYNALTLIDMFPDGDHTQRRIMETISLG